MASFIADQIIGKTLVARRAVQLRRYAADNGKIIYTAQRGETVGTVESFVGGNERGPVWWMFYDNKGEPYYTKHDEGAYDFQSLRDQGAMTTKEQTEQRKKKEQEQSGGGGGLFDGLGKDFNKTLTIGAYVVAGALAISFLRK